MDTPGGPVTLESIDQLAIRRGQLASSSQELAARAAQQALDAATKAKEAGAILVGQRSAWPSAALQQDLGGIDALTAQIDQVDQALLAIAPLKRTGFGGFFKRFGDRQRRIGLIKQRDQLAAQVGASLQTLGERAPEKTVPEADALLGSVRDELRQSSELRQQSHAQQDQLQALDQELVQRREAMNRLGFDALWTAAWLQDHEPVAIDSPVELKGGEVAWISAPARLSRQTTRTQWKGSSQGFSFPIAHTGIRYRVGSYRGHPIQTPVIKDLDSGSLVLTNQRLVFVGRLRSVTIGLQHIVHVEAYTDALAVFQDKRETPDFFKLGAPQYVLFYVNYSLNRLK